jgi:hypothetical protein
MKTLTTADLYAVNVWQYGVIASARDTEPLFLRFQWRNFYSDISAISQNEKPFSCSKSKKYGNC